MGSTSLDAKGSWSDEEVYVAFSGGTSSSVFLMQAAAANKKIRAIYVDTGLMREDDYERARAIAESIKGVEFLAVRVKEKLQKKLTGVHLAKEKVRLVEGAIVSAVGKIAKESKASRVVWAGRTYNGPPPVGFQLVQPLAGMTYLNIARMAKLFPGLNVSGSYEVPAAGLALRLLGELSEDGVEEVRRVTSLFRCGEEGGHPTPVLFPVEFHEKLRPDPMVPAYEEGVTPIFAMFGAHFVEVGVLSRRVDGGEGGGYGKVVTLEASDEEGVILQPQRKMSSLIREKLLSIDPSIGRILLKVSKGESDKAVVIRSMQTYDLITAEPLHLPYQQVERLCDEVEKQLGRVQVYFDLTPKPPGAIEFERCPPLRLVLQTFPS